MSNLCCTDKKLLQQALRLAKQDGDSHRIKMIRHVMETGKPFTRFTPVEPGVMLKAKLSMQ